MTRVGPLLRCRLGLPAPRSCRASECFFLLIAADLLLDGQDDIRSILAKPRGAEVLDELRERRLPGLLIVIVLLAELLRVHSQLAGHLDVGVRQMMAPARIYPGLQLLVGLLFLPGHSMHHQWMYS